MYFLDKFIPLAKASPFVLSDKSHVSGGPWDVTLHLKKLTKKLYRYILVLSMEMNKHSIDNFVNEVTGSTSDGDIRRM